MKLDLPRGNLPQFSLGRLLATPGALAALDDANVSPLALLSRHACGDWGDACAEDRLANDSALVNGSRVMSVYRLPAGKTVWIITEADRSATTLLLPSEY
jgi:hypothetical protein